MVFQLPHGLNRRLVADLANKIGTEDLLKWLEIKTSALARKGWDPAQRRIQLSADLLDSLRISTVIPDSKVPGLAELEPAGDEKFRIKIHTFAPKAQQRFWVAHELAHTFWFRSDGTPLSPWQSSLADDPTIEWLCNRAAAALLVPKGLLEDHLCRRGGSLCETIQNIHFLWEISDELCVTIELLARRWLHEIMGELRNIVAVTGSMGEGSKISYKVKWVVIDQKIVAPLRSMYGRVVPFHAIPIGIDPGRTIQVMIDGRWAGFVRQRYSSVPTAKFDSLSNSPEIEGIVARKSNLLRHDYIIAF